jgi:hypothetical protein
MHEITLLGSVLGNKTLLPAKILIYYSAYVTTSVV